MTLESFQKNNFPSLDIHLQISIKFQYTIKEIIKENNKIMVKILQKSCLKNDIQIYQANN
jgi:hypothetical protein